MQFSWQKIKFLCNPIGCEAQLGAEQTINNFIIIFYFSRIKLIILLNFVYVSMSNDKCFVQERG